MIAVMSYNMGQLLKNCVTSLERHAANVDLFIYDDGSDDPETQEVLLDLSSRYRIQSFERASGGSVDRKCGGLWKNMNRAVADARNRGHEYVIFMQDDMQCVRTLDSDFYSEYSEIWNADEAIGQIRSTFMKDPSITPDHVPARWAPSTRGPYLLRKPASLGILDTGILRLATLRKIDFEFGNGERNNALQSAERGICSVFPTNPFSMYLPWPPTVTKRLSYARRLIQAITDYMFKVGFHPFRDMTPDEVQGMCGRPPGELPYAERFLSLMPGDEVPRPWHYENSYSFLVRKTKRIFRVVRKPGADDERHRTFQE